MLRGTRVGFSECVDTVWGSRDSLLVERRTRDRKVESSSSGRSAGRVFFYRVKFSVLTPIRCPFHPVLPQWHVKDPDHSARSTGDRLHLNTHTTFTNTKSEWADYPVQA